MSKLATFFYDYLFSVIVSWIIVYGLLLPILVFPMLLFLLFRKFVSILLSLFYGGEWQLMDPADSALSHTFKSCGNVNTYTVLLYLEGKLSLDELQKRVQKCVYLKRSDGSQPYWKLRNTSVCKYGYMWWQDCTQFFNVGNHVRYMPNFDQFDQIYSEKAILENISELVSEPWNNGKTTPKWEFLIVPRMQTDQGQVYGCLVVRMAHEYGDGISIMQMFRRQIFDKPTPELLLDPVNLPKGFMNKTKKALAYAQTIIWGPVCFHRFLTNFNPTGNLQTSKIRKYFGRQKMEIQLEDLRKIPKCFGVSTSAIFHSCICGAVHTLSKAKGASVPQKMKGGLVYALLPYPNDHLQNNLSPVADLLPADILDPVDRARRIETLTRQIAKPYSLLTSRLICTLVGILPVPAIKASYSALSIDFVVSNVPGLKDEVRFEGYAATFIWGCPPSCKGIKYTIGVGCFNQRFIIGFVIEQNSLVQSESDFKDFISSFENELQLLITKSEY